MEKRSETFSKDCLCEALLELKSLQDYLSNSSTKYFGKLLPKLIGVDTIPFFFLTKDGLFTLTGSYVNPDTGKEVCFSTNYFRVESVDKDSCCAVISLLQPLDIEGRDATSICKVIKLKRTTTCVHVDLSCVCGIQPLDLDLLRRKIIVEPKW
ncbi:CotY/CotZ family spore coat protein [Cytobacillus sp. FJAT-54145]|uniref:CotY/CotZ family spore coat protein n=1 Tax=Cytobacillus spartinae TaxID=3299023 RepID=A0ABW6K500_9BACI